jgi:heme oxygenase
VPDSFHTALRAATAVDHAAVDAAFGAFDLSDHDGYVAFLTAHARALPAVEAALAAAGETGFRPRARLIAQDLAALGAKLPDMLPLAPPANPAARAGMLYVIEGSRLGGGLLARQVPAGLPAAYLSATHLPGEWRALLARLDVDGDRAAAAEAIESARTVFDLYKRAALST